MGFLKDAIGLAGIGVGVYAGGLIGIAASITGNDSLEELSQKAFNTSAKVGDRLGDIAERSIDASKSSISSYSAGQNNTGQNECRIEKALDVFNE